MQWSLGVTAAVSATRRSWFLVASLVGFWLVLLLFGFLHIVPLKRGFRWVLVPFMRMRVVFVVRSGAHLAPRDSTTNKGGVLVLAVLVRH